MSTESVLVNERDSVLVISINRPDKRNALNREVAVAIAAAVDELDARTDLRAAVLTGSGGVFSAGMDLKAFLDGESPDIPGRGLCGITEVSPTKPLIAAVEGWALAGGFELALACDLIVAGTSARFGVPEVKRSLVAAAGGALVLPRRIPVAIAMEMLLTGEPIGSERAAAIGLVNRVVADGAALPTAISLATGITANGPLAVAATKRLVRSTGDWTMETAWLEQKAIIDPVFGSEDAREGARAFTEKRAPIWQNK